MKIYTYSFKKLVYRIRNIGKTKGYIGNDTVGTFEFLTEANAKKYIKEEKLKNVVIDEVIIDTTESIRTL